MDEKKRIQDEIKLKKEVISKVEATMGSIPANCVECQQFALDQLKSELEGLEKMLSE